ncbi:MAG: class I SAM-dependent methyltransferase [Methylocapsa sp.]|nr:class I SAM-dependent methyltransferase [Methylocapsa sp.]
MSAGSDILMRLFGRPQGFLGRLGGLIMARTNRACAEWVLCLLDVQPNDKVLEAGFGPGVCIELLTGLAKGGYIFGVDISEDMLAQAARRNKKAIASGHVELRRGSAASLAFANNSFDKALAINSMQVWPDALAGLREMRRVLKPGGKVALGFTPYSGQANKGLPELLGAAGFADAHVVEKGKNFCALAVKLRDGAKGAR